MAARNVIGVQTEIQLGSNGFIELLEARKFFDATAATIHLDPSYGQGGFASPNPGDSQMSAPPYEKLTAAPGGGAYAIIYTDSWGAGERGFDLVRLRSDGSLDPTFAGDGSVTVEKGTDFMTVGSVLVQNDGKVVLAVQDLPFQLRDPILLMRFNVDGTPDATFGSGGTDVLEVMSGGQDAPVAWLTPEGKIDVLDMGESPDNGVVQIYLRQYNADGSQDLSVGGNALQLSTIEGHEAGDYEYAAVVGAQLLDDGGSVAYLVDQTETDAGGAQYELVQIRMDSGGHVTADRVVYRTSDIDYQWPIAAAIQSDGKVLVLDIGSDPTTRGQLTQIGLNGQIDRTFGDNGVVQTLPVGFNGSATSVTVTADGKILVTLHNANTDSDGMVQLNADGSPDTTFAGGQGVFGFNFNQHITEVTELNDGSILTSVSLDTPYWIENGVYSTAIARIMPDGGTPGTFDLQSQAPAEFITEPVYEYPSDDEETDDSDYSDDYTDESNDNSDDSESSDDSEWTTDDNSDEGYDNSDEPGDTSTDDSVYVDGDDEYLTTDSMENWE